MPRAGQVILEPGYSEDEVKVRVSPEIADDLRTLLDNADIRHSQIIELSQTTEIAEILGLFIGPGGAIWALKPVIIALIEKNKGKRVVVKHGSDEVTFEGYAPRQVEQLLTNLQDRRDESARQWEEITKRGRHARPDELG